MEFPTTLAVKRLRVTHPAYKCDRVQELLDFYEGGLDFPIDKYLRKKAIELSADPMGAVMRKARVNAGFYTDYFGDCIDDQVNQIARTALCIHDPESRPYWAGLAGDTDGARTSATEQARAALADDFVLNHAWYLVRFPAPDATLPGGRGSLAEQLTAGELDARIEAVPARTVKRWKHNSAGELEWARLDDVTIVDDGIDGAGEMEEYSWTFYAIDATATYTARKAKNATFADDAVAVRQPVETHNLGVPALFDVRRRFKCWVGNRLLPTAKQLVNEESDTSFYVMTTITGAIFVFSDDALEDPNSGGLKLTPFGGVRLRQGDKIDRDKCDAGALQALSAQSAERRSQLSAMIYGMAKQSASQSASGQNTSRESGAKKEHDQAPLKAFLNAFAEPHVACWQRMVDAIAALRGGAGEISVEGLVDCSSDDDDAPDMDAATQFLALPRVPDVAKNTFAVRIGVEMNEDEPEDVLQTLRDAPAAEVQTAALAGAPTQQSLMTNMDVGKVPLALQQMALARQRFKETGDEKRAEQLARKMDELMAMI